MLLRARAARKFWVWVLSHSNFPLNFSVFSLLNLLIKQRMIYSIFKFLVPKKRNGYFLVPKIWAADWFGYLLVPIWVLKKTLVSVYFRGRNRGGGRSSGFSPETCPSFKMLVFWTLPFIKKWGGASGFAGKWGNSPHSPPEWWGGLRKHCTGPRLILNCTQAEHHGLPPGRGHRGSPRPGL